MARGGGGGVGVFSSTSQHPFRRLRGSAESVNGSSQQTQHLLVAPTKTSELLAEIRYRPDRNRCPVMVPLRHPAHPVAVAASISARRSRLGWPSDRLMVGPKTGPVALNLLSQNRNFTHVCSEHPELRRRPLLLMLHHPPACGGRPCARVTPWEVCMDFWNCSWNGFDPSWPRWPSGRVVVAVDPIQHLVHEVSHSGSMEPPPGSPSERWTSSRRRVLPGGRLGSARDFSVAEHCRGVGGDVREVVGGGRHPFPRSRAAQVCSSAGFSLGTHAPRVRECVIERSCARWPRCLHRCGRCGRRDIWWAL
jgi:hypothetical protein